MRADRTLAARDRAERALGRLLDASGHHWSELTLIGGLLPERLVGGSDPHQGTTDIDIILDLALVFDRDEQDFAWLEAALAAAGFQQEHPNTGWRWATSVDGYKVRIEFLVDTDDNRGQEVALPGAPTLGAMNVSGPRIVLESTIQIDVQGRPAIAADLGGFILAKCAAVVGRDEARDLYDLAFVVVHAIRNGTDVAAEVARVSDGSRVAKENAATAVRLFVSPDAPGSIAYAAGAYALDPDTSLTTHALDATAAMRIIAEGLL